MTYDKDTIEFLPKPTVHNFIDLEGRKFTKLTVLGFAGTRNQRAQWWCECQCGNVLMRQGKLLLNGHQRSCGCLGRETTILLNTTHGLSHLPEYVNWCAMHTRSTNPRQKGSHRYVGRGIGVCEEWHSFERFYADMGPKPSSKHTVERIDNNQGYSPDNCKWATHQEQCNNKEQCRLITFQGRTQTLAMWCRELHLSYSTVNSRLNRGHWAIDDAFSSSKRTLSRLP